MSLWGPAGTKRGNYRVLKGSYSYFLSFLIRSSTACKIYCFIVILLMAALLFISVCSSFVTSINTILISLSLVFTISFPFLSGLGFYKYRGITEVLQVFSPIRFTDTNISKTYLGDLNGYSQKFTTRLWIWTRDL